MSVAASTTTETKGSSEPMGLWAASMIGAVYVLASLAVVLFAVPQLWKSTIGSVLTPAIGELFSDAIRVFVQLAALVGLVVFGMKLAGDHPPRGLRGGVFLAISSILVAFFLIKGFVSTLERMSTRLEVGQFVSVLFYSFCLFLFWKFLRSDRMQRWSVNLEAAGWFDTKSYKRNQGLRVRRLTILGLFLVFGSGIYTMIHNHIITNDDWIATIPFTNSTVTLIPKIKWTIPLILVGLTIWLAWRLVNYPVFADFLIATEAEINKVSWTPRAKLIRDTIVVLVTVFIITLFLFIVDIFWAKLLSRSWIGVLPSSEEMERRTTQRVDPNEW
jgi:preprotein translocase SecE subunit